MFIKARKQQDRGITCRIKTSFQPIVGSFIAQKQPNVSTAIDAQFTNTDAYMGGSCLQVKGKATDGNADLILYKTLLEGNGGNIVAKLAVKNGKEAMNTSQLISSYALRIRNNWKEYLVSNPAGTNWEEKEIALSDLTSSDVIDRIGLRVKTPIRTLTCLWVNSN